MAYARFESHGEQAIGPEDEVAAEAQKPSYVADGGEAAAVKLK
jgi:hypothetical protein